MSMEIHKVIVAKDQERDKMLAAWMKWIESEYAEPYSHDDTYGKRELYRTHSREWERLHRLIIALRKGAKEQ